LPIASMANILCVMQMQIDVLEKRRFRAHENDHAESYK